MGLWVPLKRARLPSSESPYQLTKKPKDASHSQLISRLDRMYPAAIMTEPAIPIHVRVFDVTHFG